MSDGWLIERAPLEAFAAGEHFPVPLIVSTNQDEVAGVIAPELTDQQYPVLVEALFASDFTPEMLERYPLADFASPRAAVVRMISDARYACPARRTARAAVAGGSPVFRSIWARGSSTATSSCSCSATSSVTVDRRRHSSSSFPIA